MSDFDALEEAIGADMAIDALTDEIKALRTALEKSAAIPCLRVFTNDCGECGPCVARAALAASKINPSEIVKTEPIKGGRRLICRVCEKAAYWLNHDQICEECL